jgi:transcriptional regulator with XRE-family HTH domain
MNTGSSEQAGRAVRKLRLGKGWTLAQLSERSGVPLSTLSKLELGQVSLSYEKLVRLCRALGVDLEKFVRHEAEHAPAAGRRAVVRTGAGEPALFGVHPAEIAGADLLGKAFTPAILNLAPDAKPGRLESLPGDVYLLVLDGEAVLTTEIYAPLKLNEGDAIYFDGRTPHALAAGDGSAARVLIVAAGDGLETE